MGEKLIIRTVYSVGLFVAQFCILRSRAVHCAEKRKIMDRKEKKKTYKRKDDIRFGWTNIMIMKFSHTIFIAVSVVYELK